MGPQINVDVLPPTVVEKWAKSRNVKIIKVSKIPALLDSGASVTGIDSEMLQRLQYPPIGITNLSSPSGTMKTSIYMVRLIIPSQADPGFPRNIPRIVMDNVRVIAVNLSNQPYKILLGRDILSKVVLIYNGPQALITLSY